MLCKIEANFIKVMLEKILINLFCKQRFGKRNNYPLEYPPKDVSVGTALQAQYNCVLCEPENKSHQNMSFCVINDVLIKNV